jgi:tRNA pseudouridine55 synthase
MTINDFSELPERGIFLIDKPLEWTSFDVVKKMRWLCRQKFNKKKYKVGHTGTLDPLATGLLVICVGKATKEIPNYTNDEKAYVAEIILGATRPSYDCETEIDQNFDVSGINEKQINEVAASFLGEQLQTPPIFSAKKVDGKRAYDLARAGKDVDLKKSLIEIKKMEITEISMPSIKLDCHVSKGTYIRSIAHDFGQKLNNGAYLNSLRRTQVGEHHLKDALSIQEFEDNLKKLEFTEL